MEVKKKKILTVDSFGGRTKNIFGVEQEQEEFIFQEMMNRKMLAPLIKERLLLYLCLQKS